MNLLIAFDDRDEAMVVVNKDVLVDSLRGADSATIWRFTFAEYVDADESEHKTWEDVRRYGYSCRAFIPWNRGRRP